MPPRTSFETIDCSIARTMAVLGEPWTALILRDLFIGITRFDALHAHLGVSRKILALRLSRLVSEEILLKRAYAQRPERFDYLLTAKGWQLCDILLAISAWGDQWTTSEAGPPALIRHRQCDHLTIAEIRCSHCRDPLHAADTVVTPLRRSFGKQASTAITKPVSTQPPPADPGQQTQSLNPEAAAAHEPPQVAGLGCSPPSCGTVRGSSSGPDDPA